MNKAEWIKGKSVDDILSMSLKDVNRLTESQLKTVVGRLVSAGNKRLRRYEAKKGKLPTSANEGSYEKMKFSTVGKDRKELMEEFKRAKTFMKGETSSLRGAERVKKNVVKELKNYGVDLKDLTPENYEKFWDVYKKLREKKPSVKDRNLKYTVFDSLKTMITGESELDVNTMVEKMEKKLKSIYEADKELSDSGTSRFYEV